jgi:hypothetical protein
MKKLPFFIICIVFIATSCKKEEKTPTPITPAPAATSMTATETALVGIWHWDKMEFWSATSIIYTSDHITHPTLASAYMDLQSGFYGGITGQTPPILYQSILYGDGVTGSSSSWRVLTSTMIPEEMLDLGNTFPFNGGYIESISSTTLIVKNWSGNVPNGPKTYYSR